MLEAHRGGVGWAEGFSAANPPRPPLWDINEAGCQLLNKGNRRLNLSEQQRRTDLAKRCEDRQLLKKVSLYKMCYRSMRLKNVSKELVSQKKTQLFEYHHPTYQSYIKTMF